MASLPPAALLTVEHLLCMKIDKKNGRPQKIVLTVFSKTAEPLASVVCPAPSGTTPCA
jgi:hypothetical protein